MSEKRNGLWNASKNDWLASLPDASIVTAKESGCFNDGWFRGYEAGLSEGIPQGTLDGFDAGHAAADDWVAIEDGLPDDHDWYLVAADYDGGIQGLTEINYFGGEFNERVIAWQPLPKPYQRPNDEEKNK